MKVKAYTFRELDTFEPYLSNRLRKDHINEPLEGPERSLNLARIKGISKDRAVAARNLLDTNDKDLDDYYREVVVFAVEEVMIDVVHVERKLRGALAKGGNPGRDLQVLVDECKWADLAAFLVGDRTLAAKILARNGHPAFTHWMIMRGIDQVQNTYFKEITNRSAFTINARAKA